ncbi:MAG: tripartite tricarboxylate transporter permease [Candidatus Woesearchaeota archaeon]
MLLEIFLAILIGCTFGIFTGLIPGIHINLVSILVISFSATLLQITTPLIIAIFIISMAITHTFLDTIPSVFLGAPESETALSVLPGHKMLLKGNGHKAIILTLIGSLFSLILAIIFSPLIMIIVGKVYPILSKVMGYILILASSFLIFKERKSRIWALIIFIYAGTLGLAVLNMPNLNSPLFPLLSGLFGVSMLSISLLQKVNIPKQKIKDFTIDKKTTFKALSSSLAAGGLCSFLPGLGPAQAAILGSQLTRNLKSEGFLILVGGLNTVNMVLSFIGLYIIDKARNGAIVAVSELLDKFTLNNLVLFFGVALVVAGIATFLTINLSKLFAKLMSKVNYAVICISVIVLITILVAIISGPWGLLVLLGSTALGIVPAELGIGRNHLMGCLLLPVILYFI